jgi:hypothetical protein
LPKVNNLVNLVTLIPTQVYPVNYEDWDEKEGTDVVSGWRKNLLEMKLLLALFAAEHVLLCTPLFILVTIFMSLHAGFNSFQKNF